MTKISIGQFAILTDAIPTGGNIQINTALKFLYAFDVSGIACELSILFSDDSNTALLKLTLTCEFEIHPDDWISMIKNDILTIPKAVQEFLAVQTIGTSRGVLFCKTEGSPFSQLILPPIDATAMIKKDIILHKEENA